MKNFQKLLQDINHKNLIESSPLIGLSIWILMNSFLSINGNHPWKQTEAIAQIDAILNPNNFPSVFYTYDGSNIYWDTPVYQYLVSFISKIFRFEALQSVRILNCGLLFFSVNYSYLLFNRICNIPRFIFYLIIVFNPQIIHYYSSPLVDLLPIALCSFSIYKLSAKNSLDKFQIFLYSSPFLLAVIVKPPIPFYYGILFLVFNIFERSITKKNFFKRLNFIFFPSIPLIMIVEKIRTNILSANINFEGGEIFHKDLIEQFGTLSDRFSLEILIAFIRRFFLLGGDFNNLRILFIIVITFVLIILFIKYSEVRLITFVFLMTSFLDWMSFTPRQVELDYYSLASQFLFSYMIASYLCQIYKSNSKYLLVINNINPNFLSIILIMFFLFFIPRFDLLSNTSKYTYLSPLEHFLASKETTLYVYGLAHDHPDENFELDSSSTYFGMYGRYNTSIGGYLRNKFETKTFKELDNYCQNGINSYINIASIVFPSNKLKEECKVKIKSNSEVYIENDKYVFWYKN